jgi:hypothetical protein
MPVVYSFELEIEFTWIGTLSLDPWDLSLSYQNEGRLRTLKKIRIHKILAFQYIDFIDYLW